MDVAETVQVTGFNISTGASDGYVLTSDASGGGTWQEAAAGVSSINFQYDTTFSISLAQTITLVHGLGGDPAKYIVFTYGRCWGGTIHQSNYGINSIADPGMRHLGCNWHQLTSTSISVTRASGDDQESPYKQWDEAILRILKNQ